MAFTFEPSLLNSVFTPDQLIGGSTDIVTDTVTLASGLNYTRGTLLGQKTASIYTAVTAAVNSTGGANAGAETISAPTVGASVRLGTYYVLLTSTTAFTVSDPTGETVGTGTVGTAFTSAQVGFTITTGTSIAANDGFSIVIEPAAGAGTGQYTGATGTATDGSQEAKNWVILAEDTDTSSTGTNAATLCPVYIKGEFDGNYLTLGTGLTILGVKQALSQAGRALIIKTGAVVNAIV